MGEVGKTRKGKSMCKERRQKVQVHAGTAFVSSRPHPRQCVRHGSSTLHREILTLSHENISL